MGLFAKKEPDKPDKRLSPYQSEIKRILDLPVKGDWGMTLTEEVSREILHPHVFHQGFRLFPMQAEAVSDFKEVGGGFFPAPVGSGKTAVSLICASLAHAAGTRKILLIVPSPLTRQLVERDLPFWRSRFPMTCPVYILAGRDKFARMGIARSGNPGLYISTYSLLSTTDAVDLLKFVNPGLIILDECHKVKNHRTARTKRLFNYITEKQPKLIAMSGTITNKSIQDYHHIIRACLGESNPLPNPIAQMYELAEIVDSSVEAVTSSQAAPWQGLLSWARKNFPKDSYPAIPAGFRRAFQHRLMSAPGVVRGEGAEVGASILISTLKTQEPGEKLSKMMQDVRDAYLTPNGDEIECAMQTFKWLFELSAGFYNWLKWPEPEKIERRYKVGSKDAAHLLKRSQDYHEAQQEYFKVLRPFLQYDPPAGLETPLAVAKNMSLYQDKNVPVRLYQLWKAMKDKDFPDRIERDSIPVRVDSYKIEEAKKWAAKEKAGIIWVHHKEVGEWLHEEIPDSLYCPAGDNQIEDPANADRICIASIAAHGTGKNLQHFSKQLFFQFPRPAQTMEQTLGRLHRPGQDADCIETWIFRSNEFDHANLAACLNDTNYIQQTTGTKMKLLLADWNPLPKNIPWEILEEMGFNPIKNGTHEKLD